MSYKIVRWYAPGHFREFEFPVIKHGLTLAEAKEHCQDPKTRKENVYFDTFIEE